MIDITVDTHEIDRMVEQFSQVAARMPDAISAALNRTGDMTTTAIGRELAKETGAHVGTIREDITVDRSSPGDLTYTITIGSEYLPLSEFDPHETSKGISARPWATRRIFPGTFEIPNAPDHVFVRMGRERLPIRELWGANPAIEATRGLTEQVARDKVAEVFPERFKHEVGRLLGK